MLSKKKPICNGFSANKRKLGFCRRDSSTSFFRRSSSILVDKMLSWVIPLLKDTLFVYRLGTFSRKYIWKYPTGGSGRSRTNEICSKPHNHTLTGHWPGCACPFYTLFQGLLTCIVYYWEYPIKLAYVWMAILIMYITNNYAYAHHHTGLEGLHSINETVKETLLPIFSCN